MNIGDGGACSAIILAVINVAKAGNVTTTAEDVEHEWHRELLCELDCIEMQGYLFSPAVSEADIARLMSGAREAASAA